MKILNRETELTFLSVLTSDIVDITSLSEKLEFASRFDIAKEVINLDYKKVVGLA